MENPQPADSFLSKKDNRMKAITIFGAVAMFCFGTTSDANLCSLAAAGSPSSQLKQGKTMELGNFSISLAVKDIHQSKAFYEKFDFKVVGGDLAQNWLVLQNGTTKIGLFQGMFDKNLMTFNPGWTSEKQTLTNFQDVRELQRTLKARGVSMTTEADENSAGPAHFTVMDPDGNTMLFDQHVASPKRE
jgi:predicted enzyme related to lactoylglutathione lyase